MPFQNADTTSGWESGAMRRRRVGRSLRHRPPVVVQLADGRRLAPRGGDVSRSSALSGRPSRSVFSSMSAAASSSSARAADALLVVAGVEGLLELLGGGARQGGLLQLARLGLRGGEDAVLHRRGVHVDVLLAGQQHQLVHDLVGDRAQDEAVVLHALVAREVQRLADLHADADELGDLLAGRLGLVGADHRDREDRARRPRGPSGRRRCGRGRAGRRGCGCPRGRCRAARRGAAPAGPSAGPPRRRDRRSGRRAAGRRP